MNVRQAQACDLQRLPVSMAMRSHLFSYRTQKLSSSAQMVLGWTRPGRVCRRRFPKQKHPTSVGCFCFNNHPEITLRKRNGKMRDDAIVPAERGAAERLAFSRCVKERPRARRRLCCGGAAQTRTSADRDASTPVSKTKSSHNSVGFLFCYLAPNTICRVRPRC